MYCIILKYYSTAYHEKNILYFIRLNYMVYCIAGLIVLQLACIKVYSIKSSFIVLQGLIKK